MVLRYQVIPRQHCPTGNLRAAVPINPQQKHDTWKFSSRGLCVDNCIKCERRLEIKVMVEKRQSH